MVREAALAEIAAAHEAGKRAILAAAPASTQDTDGGLSPVPTANLEARAKATTLYDEMGGEAFRDALALRDPIIATRLMAGDRQRLIRAWEVVEATGTPLSAWQALPKEPGTS